MLSNNQSVDSESPLISMKPVRAFLILSKGMSIRMHSGLLHASRCENGWMCVYVCYVLKSYDEIIIAWTIMRLFALFINCGADWMSRSLTIMVLKMTISGLSKNNDILPRDNCVRIGRRLTLRNGQRWRSTDDLPGKRPIVRQWVTSGLIPGEWKPTHAP